MVVLVGCEESQEVCKAFRAMGHEAYSCDTQECSGGKPEWHLQMDIFKAIEYLKRMGKRINLFICNPPCKYLAFSGERWRTPGILSYKKGHFRLRLKALGFFMKCYFVDADMVCIENSYSLFIHRYFKRSSQVIHPWMFGHTTKKETHLWLRNLPPLLSTYIIPKGFRTNEIHEMSPGINRERLRSKSFPGIANSMAVQWG